MAARGWSLHVNGQFDEGCATVVKAFQKEKGLGVDERIGLQTWNAAWTATVTN
jgi:peptidoglycan hydrolase-like protein with peptidoglycan-binding domain